VEDAFQSKLKSLRHGMTKTQVEELLGKPSFIDTQTNHLFGTWLAGIAEVWEYWTDERGKGFSPRRGGSRQGSVCFDDPGKLQYAWAGGAQIVEPVRYPIDKQLIAHFQNILLETYRLKASRGELARPASPDAIWFSPLPTAYVYPYYSNAAYTVGME